MHVRDAVARTPWRTRFLRNGVDAHRAQGRARGGTGNATRFSPPRPPWVLSERTDLGVWAQIVQDRTPFLLFDDNPILQLLRRVSHTGA